MLKFFSRLEKTRNFVILIFAIFMAGSLIFFYAPSRNGAVQEVLSRSTETLATVGSEKITVGELALQVENMQRRYGSKAPESKLFLDSIISSRIIRTEAKRLGLTASDEEVARQIRESNKDPEGKPFDQAAYEENMTEQYGSVANAEQIFRDQISGDKVRAFVTSGVSVSEDEVLKGFQKQNTNFDVSFVSVSSTDVASKIQPTEQELKDAFEKTKANYYISEPQKKIRYLFINQAKVGEKLQIPDADLKAEYDALPVDKKQAGVQVQQIVLRVPKPELEATVTKKANDLVAQARKDGGKISEEAFGELAKGISEDPNTAREGGKIKGLVRQNLNNPTDPLQKTLSMEVGAITEPIKFGSSYYIFRRGEAVPKTYEDAKKEIEVSLRNRKAYAAAATLAQKAADRLKEVKDVKNVAVELAAEANMKVDEMVRETAFIKPGDEVKDIGISPQFEEGIAPLAEVNAVGDKTPIKDGFAIPMLAEKKEPRDAEFSEVKDKVSEAVKLEQAKAKVESIAKEIAEKAGSASGLSGAASAKGLKAEDSKNYKIGSPLGKNGAGSSEELNDAVFALKAGEVTKTPIKVGEDWFVVGATKREDAKQEEFAKQRDQLVQQMVSQKQGQVFSDYLADVRRKLESEGKIKIIKEALAKLDAKDDAEDAPPSIPNMPIPPGSLKK